MSGTSAPVGLVLGSELPPEQLGPTASSAEQEGFDQLWLAEDYFFTGGISGAAVALGATDRIPVGVGVVSAMTRHPALLAMEVSTLARAYDGRIEPAVGLGVPGWLDQMGLRPASPLSEVRGCVQALRELLSGETLDGSRGSFTFQGVELVYPLERPPRISAGVIGPRMLELSGEVADGTVLSVLVGDEYVRWARERIAAGAERAGRDPAGHRLVAFAFYHVDSDGSAARDQLRETAAFYLAAGGSNAITQRAGIADELTDMVRRGGPTTVIDEMPDEWLDMLTVNGTPEQCAERIRGLLDAGADSVALFPVPSSDIERQMAITAGTVFPLVQRG